MRRWPRSWVKEMVSAGGNAQGPRVPEPEDFGSGLVDEAVRRDAADLRRVLAAAALPKFVAVGEHDLWPLALHRRFAQSIGAKIAIYRGGHSPSETSPYQISRDLISRFDTSA